jgi:lysophospholipase L1-like esterase
VAALNNQTVRMIARTSLAGKSVRIRLSNALGASTVTIGSAHIAIRSTESSIVPGSDRQVTFSGKPSPTMYAGAMLVSDPVTLTLPPLADVAVSLYLPENTSPVTTHSVALHTAYMSRDGDFTGQLAIPDPTLTQSYYWLAGIDVLAPTSAGTLVTFGDSITDGDQSTADTNGMWPAILAARLQANKATANVGVVNAGIGGNRILGDGNSGLARLYHDAISQPGVKWIMLLEGINDITAGARRAPPLITADDLIAAYRQVIETSHLYGIKVIGCTITPDGGSSAFSEYGESVRQAANRWIVTGGAFDAVVDFDAISRDAGDPKRFRPEMDSPDLLHPSNTGYKMMGDAVPLSLFK